MPNSIIYKHDQKVFVMSKENSQTLPEEVLEAAIKLSKDISIENFKLYEEKIASIRKSGKESIAEAVKKISGHFKNEKDSNLLELIQAPLMVEFLASKKEEKLEPKPLDEKEFSAIKDLIRDRGVALESGFKRKGHKASGMSSGYIAEEKDTSDTFILKGFKKNTPLGNTSEQDIKDRADVLREHVFSPFYEFLLYNRAPKEGLVKPNEIKESLKEGLVKFNKSNETGEEWVKNLKKTKKNSKGSGHQSIYEQFEKPLDENLQNFNNLTNTLYVRSKFFKNAKTLTEFSGEQSQRIGSSDKLRDLEGFEKTIAASNILGDGDYHGENLMIKDGKEIVRIDFGKAGMGFPKNFANMISTMSDRFSSLGYMRAIEDGNLSFDIGKYNESLNSMLNRLNEEQINNIVDKKLYELEKAGFDPKGLSLLVSLEGSGKSKPVVFKNFEDLKEFFKGSIGIAQ